MERFYQTHQRARSTKFVGEKNTRPSQAIPGHSYTLAEMFKKFANGQQIPVRVITDADYTIVEHDSENWEGIKIPSDPLTAMDEATARAKRAEFNLDTEVENNKKAREEAAHQEALRIAEEKIAKGNSEKSKSKE